MAQKKSKAVVGSKNYSYIFLPALQEGWGKGHLVRCLRLASKLPSKIIADLNPIKFLPKSLNKILAKKSSRKKSIIILDQRQTDKKLLMNLGFTQPLVGLDEGGKFRPFFHYLLDSLPNYWQKELPNLRVRPIEFAIKPIKLNFPFKKILLSFGGEDKAGLTKKLLEKILSENIFKAQDITVIEGPAFNYSQWPAGIKVIRHCRNLLPVIAKVDLVFCHFGLTCFEALFSGKPVILFNPTFYHQKLSRLENLAEIGVNSPDFKKLKRILKDPSQLELTVKRIQTKYAERPTLLEAFKKLYPPLLTSCPLCHSFRATALARFPERTYFACKVCKLIWLCLWKPPRKYQTAYFFEEYKSQYGVSYLEDFSKIKMLAKARLHLIKRFVKSGRLLDIGAAYGPFLEAAREEGFKVEGIEINKEAASFIKSKLKIKCWLTDFQTMDVKKAFKPSSFEVVSLWYTIEHFTNLAGVLEKIAWLLAKGGLLTFSTPSASGISALKDKKAFLAKSPEDHFSIWAPRMVSKALKRFGFKTVLIRITGHHPERFTKKKQKPFFIIWLLLSKIFGLGDTFEIYARKIRD